MRGEVEVISVTWERRWFRDALRQAELWKDAGRVIVQTDTSSEAVMMMLGRVADAALRRLNIEPIFIRMRKASAIASIRDWAEEVIAWCEPESLPTALGQAVRFAISDQQSTPRRLLAIEDAMLVFIDPPDDADSEWFMDVVAASRRRGPLILVTGTGPSTPKLESWTRDTIAEPTDMAWLESQILESESTLLALAVLDLPLPETTLAAVGFTRAAFPIGTSFLVETRLGPLLSASAKRLLTGIATDEQKQAAHAACLAMLDSGAMTGSERLRRERLRHLVGAQRGDEALVEAAALIEAFYLDGRNVAVTECFESLRPLGQARDSLDTLALLRVVDAYVRIGKPDRAALQLRNCYPANALQRAAKLAIESEIAKNEGTPGWRDRAMAALDGAIEACREAQTIDGLAERATAVLADYEMDRARLRQYLNYDFAGAESAYRQILSEVGNMPGREFVAAAAERNLAECVLAQAPTEEPARQEAQELLLDAGARLSTKPTEHLRAEIAYVQAKLAEGEESNATLRSCARLSSASIFSQRAHRDSGHE